MVQQNNNHDSLTMPLDAERREEPTPGFTLEWIYGGKITLTTLRSTDRDTIDAWCNHWITVRKQWKPSDPPIFILSRITAAIEELTPYARRRSVEISHFRPEIPTYCAVVLPQSLIGQIVKLYIWSISTFSPNLSVRVFFDDDAGMQWLTKYVDKTG